MRKDEEPIVIEETYLATGEAVWKAITDPDQMRQWYLPNIPAFEAKVGFETRFDVECGGRVFPHVWKVTEVEPGRRLTYAWKYQGYAGASTVTFELFPAEGGTRLRLTCRAQEDFPDDIPEFSRESGLEGWTYLINQSLKSYLEGTGA